ncbi:MAG: TlyA family RNA methyltransferase [Bradymonadaceae bacterium]|nr:TlyA family RNA methyltransferase [Lujinxingiaceae bacterium]
MAAKKRRLDELLVERDLVESRALAGARVMAGEVFVNGQRIDKAGTMVAIEAEVELKGEQLAFVSRGGLKLEAALDAFGYDCCDKIVIDVGASTGGFTDCVLSRGARRVYAVDVGYGQLAWKLRQDERVVCMERTNIRTMAPDAIEERCDLAVIDCSFISLDQVLPNTLTFLKPGADVIALVKPQFEVAAEHVAKGGVVRDARQRLAAIAAVVEFARGLGLEPVDAIDCPVHGPAGNVEHLVWLKRAASASTITVSG